MPENKEKALLPSKPSQELEVKACSIHNVVVYRDRAEVRRTVNVSLPAGESEVIIKGLSESVDGDSIRVEGRGNAIILDVTYYTKQQTMKQDTADDEEEGGEDTYKAIKEEIFEKEKEIKYLGFRCEVLQKQKDMLKDFAKHVSSLKEPTTKEGQPVVPFSDNVSPNSVTGVLEFMAQYQEKLNTLDERAFEVLTQQKKLEEEKRVLQAKAEKLNPNKKKLTESETIRSVKVTLDAKENTDIVLIVSYVVSNASWTPSYDARVFTKDKTMKVNYYGLIKQSTGEDWENANIALSTAQPDVGGSAPQLGIHHIGFKRVRAIAMAKKAKRVIPAVGFGSMALEERADFSTCDMMYLHSGGPVRYRALSTDNVRLSRRDSPPSIEIDVTKVDTGQLYNTSFTIPRTATIPADNTEHKVTIAILDLQPDFSYVSIPRLSPYSFLQAVVKNTSVYALLEGPSNVFLDNNFLAKSQLPDTSPNEEFTVSLGANQAIRITCQPMNILRGSTGRLTKYNLLTYTFVYSVKNTQANVVKLKVMEQVPLSSDERLKVVLLQPDLRKQHVSIPFSHGHALLNDDNNIEWHCTIPSDTNIELQLVYTVEFPPNDIVEGLPSS